MQFQIHTDFPYSLATEWNALLAESTTHVPFLRSEYIAEWWASRGGGEWPDDSQLAIITAHEEDRLIGIAPLFIAEHEDKNNSCCWAASKSATIWISSAGRKTATGFVPESCSLSWIILCQTGLSQVSTFTT